MGSPSRSVRGEKPVSEGLLSVAERQRLRHQRLLARRGIAPLTQQQMGAPHNSNRRASAEGNDDDEIAAAARRYTIDELRPLMSAQELAELHPVDGMGGVLPPVPRSHYERLRKVQSRLRSPSPSSTAGASDTPPPPQPADAAEARRTFRQEDKEFQRFAARAGIAMRNSAVLAKTPQPKRLSGVSGGGQQLPQLSAATPQPPSPPPVPVALSPSPVVGARRDAVGAAVLQGSHVRPGFLSHLRVDRTVGGSVGALLPPVMAPHGSPLLLAGGVDGATAGAQLDAATAAELGSPLAPIVIPHFDGRYRVTLDGAPQPSFSTPPSPLRSEATGTMTDSTATATGSTPTSTDKGGQSSGSGGGSNANNYYGGYGGGGGGASTGAAEGSASDGWGREGSSAAVGGASIQRRRRTLAAATAASPPALLTAAVSGAAALIMHSPRSDAQEEEQWGAMLRILEDDAAADAARWNLERLNVAGDDESLAATQRGNSTTAADSTAFETGSDTGGAGSCGTDDPEALSRAGTWKERQENPLFRERAVLNETVTRSKVDEGARRRDWNADFQALLDSQSLTPLEARQRGEAIAALWVEFKDAVLPVVETVICERGTVEKTIPLQSIGGVAGGDKYVFGNTVIKFCATQYTTSSRLYGSYANAIKSASNERKGLNALIRAGVPHLYVPLGMVVTYLGQRVWVASRVPVSHDTLRNGSRDGGATVVADDPVAARLMATVGAALNLAPHMVGKRGGERGLVQVAGPVDLEVHCGHDGRYYALDTARLFPPDPNVETGRPRNFHLYKVLRPELVRDCEEPLSSDAFSPFGHHERERHDATVERAGLLLLREVIPEFVRALPRLFQRASVRTLFDIKGAMHREGINLRYMGIVLDEYFDFVSASGGHPQQPLVSHFATEMCARAFKVVVLEELYALSFATATPQDAPLSPDGASAHGPAHDPRFASYAGSQGHATLRNYHLHVVRLFNRLFRGDEGDCRAFWEATLIPKLRAKFPCSDRLCEALAGCYSRASIKHASLSINFFHPLLLQKASRLLGITWRVDPERDAGFFKRLGNPAAARTAHDPFSMLLLARMEPVVKLCEVSGLSAVLQCVTAGRLEEAARIVHDELAARGAAVEDPVLLVPLMRSAVHLYLLPEWGRGRPKLQDALHFARRIVLTFQEARDALGLETSNGGNSGDSKRGDVLYWTPERVAAQDGYARALCELGALLSDTDVDEALAALATAQRAVGECSFVPRATALAVRMQLGSTWKEKGAWEESYREFRAAVAIARTGYTSAAVGGGSLSSPLSMSSGTSGASFAGSAALSSPLKPRSGVLVAAEELVAACCALGEAANKLGFKKEALAATADAMAVAQQHFSPSSVAHANATVTAALVAVEGASFCTGNPDEARRAVEAALAYFVEALGPIAPQTSRAKLVLAQLQRLLGNFSDGVRLCEEALSAAQQHYGAQSHFEAVILLLRFDFTFVTQLETPLPMPRASATQQHSEAPAASGGGGSLLDDVHAESRRRFSIAASLASRALAILEQIGKGLTPYAARAHALLADVYRVSHAESTAVALRHAQRAVHILESLGLLSSREYVHAITVHSMLRVAAAAPSPCQPAVVSAVLQDLFKALAASDRHMSVADADFAVIECIAAVQAAAAAATTGANMTKAARAKVSLSRDAQLRRLECLTQHAAMFVFFDDQLNAALAVRGVMTQLRELFPKTQPWDAQAGPFIPKLVELANYLLRGTGGLPSPVTDLGRALLSAAASEEAKRAAFEQQRACDDQQREQEQRAARRALEQARLTSQLKQVYTYLGLRNAANALHLLHAAVANFERMYPTGATGREPHSIATHNAIVAHINAARRLVLGNTAAATGANGVLLGAFLAETASKSNASASSRSNTARRRPGSAAATMAEHVEVLRELEERAIEALVRLEPLPVEFTAFPTPPQTNLNLDAFRSFDAAPPLNAMLTM